MLAPLDSSLLEVIKTDTPKKVLKPEEIVFGETFTDHMLKIPFSNKTGWGTPKIEPYGNLSLDPSASVFHYGFELFEGFKAYKRKDGKIMLFRPEMNMKRMNKSASTICLPNFDSEELILLIEELLRLDSRFVPSIKGYSLYIRPTLISTGKGLNYGPPQEAMLFVICSPVGPYYGSPIKLEATDNVTRAWPGGVGDSKLGANYAPCMKPQVQAAKRGYQQNLWLFGEKKQITEVGMMNFFVVMKDRNTGKKELVTAPLDGTILEGITRDSILRLCREKLNPSEWLVSERYFTIFELLEKAKTGELVEAFGAGTAAVVSSVKEIGYNSETIKFPATSGEESGELTTQILKWILEIQYGEVESDWGRVIDITT